MNRPQTIRHAIEYLKDAARLTCKSEWQAFRACDPCRSCAAYGLAKDTFFGAGSLEVAITDLQKKLEAT